MFNGSNIDDDHKAFKIELIARFLELNFFNLNFSVPPPFNFIEFASKQRFGRYSDSNEFFRKLWQITS